MRYLFLWLLLFLTQQSDTLACEPADLATTKHAIGEMYYVSERDQWRQPWSFGIFCEAESIGVRTALIKWHVEEQPMRPLPDDTAADSLEARAETYRLLLLQSLRVQTIDWQSRIDRTVAYIAEHDIRPLLVDIVAIIVAMEDPTVGEMAYEWRIRAGQIMWIRTAEQADSLLYRVGDAQEPAMTGVGILNYIKAHAPWME